MSEKSPVMSSEAKSKGGRPRLAVGLMRSVQVTLDDETIRKGRELGAGNLSVGIRKALNLRQVLGLVAPASPDALPAESEAPKAPQS